MKRTLRNLRGLVLAAAFVSSLFAVKAQNYLIKETFDNFPNNMNSGAFNGWSGVVISGNSSVDFWQFNNSIGYSIPSPLKGKVALADCYMGGYPNTGSNNANQQDLALVTPSVNTVGLSNLTLTYDQMYMQLSASAIYLDVSTDNGSNWSNIYSTTSGSFFSNSQSFNLSGYTGYTDLKIRFRWTTPATTTHGYWMIDNVKLFSRYSNDVGVEALLNPKNNACPSAAQVLGLKITNYGTSTASGINVNLGVTGGATGTFSTSISSLGAGASTTVLTSSTINTTAGGNVTFTGYTTYGSDQTTTNDTLITTVATAPTPTDPSGPPVVQCGVGPVSLQATAGAGETTVWYNDASTTSALGGGNPFVTPFPVYADRKFYAENTRTLPNSHTNYMTGVYRWNANTEKAIFFDITAANEIVLDSFYSNFAYAGTYLMKVYYKTGTFYGYATNQSAFTLLAVDTVTSAGLGRSAYIDLKNTKLRIGAGNTYGFVITMTYAPGPVGNLPEFAFKIGTTSNLANDDISIYAEGVANTAWSAFVTGYCGDIGIHYQKVCKSQRKPIDVVIIPRPAGVGYNQAAPFKGLYRSGTILDPDVVRLNDTFAYELAAPTGFTNAQFGTGWRITAFSFQTPGGMPPNSADTMTTFPSAGGPGRLRYIPSSGVDSVLRIRVTVQNMTTMCDTTVNRYIIIGGDPKARFAVATACEGDQLTFNNGSTIASGNMSFKWYFGDGDSSEIAHPKHVYSTSGSYNVRLVAKSNHGFVSTFDSTILVYEIPTANFGVPAVCDGATHQFTDASGIPSIGTPTYEWDFGDGSPVSTQVNPTHKYTVPDFYSVRLTVNVNGCKHSVVKYATLAPRAAVSFTAQTNCNNAEAVFNNGSTLLFGTYGSRWKFGDNTQSTTKNPKHKYATFGNVGVTLIITTDLGCVDSVTNTVSLIEAPHTNFSLSSVCSEEDVQITNLTNPPSVGTNSYKWDFGGGVTSVVDNPIHSFPGPGVYSVELWALSPNGCMDSVTKQISIDTKPIANFVASDVCQGQTTSFLNNTINIPNGVTYFWSFGNGKNSGQKDTAFVYSAVGSYDVYLYVSTPNGCFDTAKKVLKVNAIPSSAFNVTTANLGNGSMYFEGPTGTGLSYQWFLGDGDKQTAPDFIHQYPFTGTYTVKLVVTSSEGCSSTTTQLVSVSPSGLMDETRSLRIYPNPSSGEVNIDMSTLPQGEVNLTVRDIAGKTIVNRKMQAGSIYTLNLGHLAPGSYIVEAVNGENYYSGKIVITD